MWHVADDKSIVDSRGKIIFISRERFLRDIAWGNCCFICGARPEDKKFDDEHILPQWLLRRYDLFSKTITLPNNVAVRYDGYTVSCCEDCNDLMGEHFEEPVSNAVRDGPDAIKTLLNEDRLKLYTWLALIYLKTHLRDKSLRYHLDARKGTESIADGYDWDHLYHVHAVVRHFYSGYEVHEDALGSCLFMPVRREASTEPFDYGNLYFAQTSLIRLEGIALLTVFGDSGGALGFLYDRIIKRITGAVSDVQARELMVDLAFYNLHLKVRPVFQTRFDLDKEEGQIIIHRPPHPTMYEPVMSLRGGLFESALHDVIPTIRIPGCTREEVSEAIKAGRFTLLFDANGQFLRKTWGTVDPEQGA